MAELKELNNLSSNNLSVGQVLKIPSVSSDDNANEDLSNTSVYTVIKGDSLYSIAKKYNITVDELKKLNNLSSNLLSIGQILKVPDVQIKEPISINYKVVSGDSLYSIAKKYNTSVDELKRINNLSSNLLNVGQILKMPTTNNGEQINNYKIYKVVSGDSLYSIARKYNTTVDELKKINNLSSNLLSIGQSLKIPS